MSLREWWQICCKEWEVNMLDPIWRLVPKERGGENILERMVVNILKGIAVNMVVELGNSTGRMRNLVDGGGVFWKEAGICWRRGICWQEWDFEYAERNGCLIC
ncbi:hypothetical protein CDAR_267461 [Caerostris darwini]|uniref:Uncharacterized protein n=1 Tax=Caerostris darwini TaxID=1538125 RepID=A0AAV4TJR6_9ARAC|nr:hypothetical protein CDAR_267461 [Caerostris darwini]